MFTDDGEIYPMVDLDSDEDIQSNPSSEDEVDVILHGTPQQKRKLRRRSLGHKSSSSEDEFEKEMTQDLNRAMSAINQQHDIVFPSSTSDLQKGQSPKKTYNECYFDSDSDDDQTSEEKKDTSHPMLSNDDLFYDPSIDDDNQHWMDKQRQLYQPSASKISGENGSAKKLPNSDAVLNCPACMSMVCMDCQRHDTYRNQYRAMFVMKCKVDYSEVLHCKPEALKKGKKKKKQKNQNKEPSNNQAEQTEAYHPVHCEVCNTHIAMFDTDEVFHFFNVLASH